MQIVFFALLALFIYSIYWFWERSHAFQRNFFRQIAVDLLRACYSLYDRWRDLKNKSSSWQQIPVAQLTNDSELMNQARKYQATPYPVLDKIFARLCPLGLQNYQFIDYGCGMGRVLLEARKAGFQKIIGLDISQKALQNCRKNLSRHPHAYRHARLLQRNAAEFYPENGPLVAFLFNPFNQETLKQVLENLNNHIGTKILVYVNPVCHDLLIQNKSHLLMTNHCLHDDFSFNIYRLEGRTTKSFLDESFATTLEKLMEPSEVQNVRTRQ